MSSTYSIKVEDPNSTCETSVDTATHPTCTVTRGMKKKSREAQVDSSTSFKEVDLGTSYIANLLEGSTYETTASVSSRQQLIIEQKKDAEIAKLRDHAVSEAEQLAECYYLKDNLLMRKWSYCDNEIKKM